MAQCKKCLFEDEMHNVIINQDGICNVCNEYESIISNYQFTKEKEDEYLLSTAEYIKKNSTGEYDVILGLSGGVDSSYCAHLVNKMGLNPLVVHFDNGWNSETAIQNINKIITKHGYELHTFVIDWPMFRDIQRSYFKADVVDIEAITDHAIMATLFKIRKEKNIRFVISGNNYVTEHGMPKHWNWNKQDLVNLKDIHRKFGEMKLKKFPTMSSFKFHLARLFSIGGEYIEPLNNINYSKSRAINELKELYGWKEYPGKHFESVFTKFYQAYILPMKFNIDKRTVHYSALIRNGELTKDEAVTLLSHEQYNKIELKTDISYVCKKLGFTESEFFKYIERPQIPHDHYKSDKKFVEKLKLIKRFFNIK